MPHLLTNPRRRKVDTRTRDDRHDANPPTLGRALIAARKILGPSGHVCQQDGRCSVGTFDERGFVSIGSGTNWRAALALARDSAEAKQYQVVHQAQKNFVRTSRLRVRAAIAAMLAGSNRRELRFVIGYVNN